MGNIERKSLKRTKAEQMDMVNICIEWLGQGLTSRDIVIKLEMEYEYKEDNCYNVIKQAYKKLAETNEQKVEELRASYSQMYQNLYKIAMEQGNIRTARGVLDSLSKIQGVVITKVEITDNTFDVDFK